MANLLHADLGSLLRRSSKAEPGSDAALEAATPFAPRLPQVNLLPERVRTSIRLTRVRRAGTWWLVGVVVVSAALWLLQAGAISTAEQRLAQAQATNAQVQAHVQALSPIEQMAMQLERQQGLVETALAGSPQTAAVIDHLRQAAAQAGRPPTEFVSIQVAYHGVPTAGGVLNPCPNPDPFGQAVTIGCLTFSATAANRDQVTAMLRAMEADPWFVGPYVGTSTINAQTTTGATTVTFSGTSGLSHLSLQTPLTDEQLAALTAPPTPAPSPSPQE